MQVYTKILIGMLVGVLVGLLLGPNSPLLPADTYKISAWDRLALFGDRSDPGTRVVLPQAPRTDAMVLHLDILEVEHESDLPRWSKVQMTYDRRLALHDPAGAIRGAVGNPAIGGTFELWVEHERRPLDGGGFAVWPLPVSGIGDALITAFSPLGDVFMRLITMVIVPLVFASLLVGVASLGDVRKLGRVGVRTLSIYLATTAVAVTIGLVVAHVVNPGSFIGEASRVSLQAQFEGDVGKQIDRAASAPSMIENLVNVIPTNPVASLVTGDMLQVIFFSVFFGIALTLVPGEAGKPVVDFMDRIQQAMVVIIHIVMKFAPIGVAALVAEVVGNSGLSVLKGLLVYSLVVLVGLLLHGLLVYGSLVRLVARLPFLHFLRAIRPALLIAFSTSSSSATLPVTLDCAEKNLRVSNPVASFVLPLGSTVNMDGTALYQGVAAIFIAQVFGMDLSLGDQLAIVLTATMASIGAAGVPGAGMVTLTMVLTATGIPTVGVALILGVDRILDMFRTTINVTGDLAVSAVIARLEGESLAAETPPEERDAARTQAPPQ